LLNYHDDLELVRYLNIISSYVVPLVFSCIVIPDVVSLLPISFLGQ
jgi:hypothetical protein